MEDALKRLDMMTQEEVRMAVAQNLRAVGAIVRGVEDTVAAVSNRVAEVDNRVAGVDSRVVSINDTLVGIDDIVKGIDSRVAGVNDRVRVVDNRVIEAIHGSQIIFSHAWDMFNLNRSDGKVEKQVMKQTVDGVDQVKGLSSPDLINWQALHIFSSKPITGEPP
jgi:hypothetical protein